MFEKIASGDMFALTLEQAVYLTLKYAHVFHFPLTFDELHRYLIGYKIGKAELEAVIHSLSVFKKEATICAGYYLLSGHENHILLREQHRQVALRLWPEAWHYATRMSALPYIEMIALSGALAVGNEAGVDIDYFMVTQPGRLWVSRAWVLIFVKLALLRGLVLCPNYMVTTNHLAFKPHDIYTAHEIAHMIPLTGKEVYTRVREQNQWVNEFLPNAEGAPHVFPFPSAKRNASIASMVFDKVLSTRIGDWLESWESSRKIKKFTQNHHLNGETEFSQEVCKGHFGGYRTKALWSFHSKSTAVD